jgi:hypothetical protein
MLDGEAAAGLALEFQMNWPAHTFREQGRLAAQLFIFALAVAVGLAVSGVVP